MAIKIIPLISEPSFEQRTELEGIIYTLAFRYNERNETWVMDILTSGKEMLVAGIILHINQDLLRQYQDDRLPKGLLWLHNIVDELENPTVENFGLDTFLLYDEVAV